VSSVRGAAGGTGGRKGGRQVAQPRHKGGAKSKQSADKALKTAGLADAEAGPHQHAKVEARDVDEQPLGDVVVVTQVSAPQTTGLEGVGEAALDELSSTAHQRPAALTVFPSTVGVDGIALVTLASPSLAIAPRLRDVGSPACQDK
jgi:hypothetical protein